MPLPPPFTHPSKGHQADQLLCGAALGEAGQQVMAANDTNVAMQRILHTRQ